MKGIILSALLIGLFTSQVFAAPVATVSFVRGKVTLDDKPLKKGQEVPEGAIIITKKRSIAKLQFQDQTRLTIAPKSEVKVAKFEKGKPGLISLLKGKIRANVEKEKDGKDKLFINTPTAAMGVRGTKFDAVFNPFTRKSSVVTFSGIVAMANMAINANPAAPDFSAVAAALQSDNVVSSVPGTYMAMDPKLGRPSLPVKVSPSQISTMQKNDNFKDAGGKKAQVKKSHLPPGFAPGLFNNDNKAFAEEALGAETIVAVETELAAPAGDLPPPEGVFNADTGEFAPPAGGYVAPNGEYVAPVPGKSYFDPVAGVYVPTSDFGGVDPATGEYLPPEGFALTDTGEFVKDDGNLQEGEFGVAAPTNSSNQDSDPLAGPGAGPDGGPQILQPGEVGDFDVAFSGGEDGFDGGGDFGSFDGDGPPPPPGEGDDFLATVIEDEGDLLEDGFIDSNGTIPGGTGTTNVNVSVTINP